MWRAWQFPPDPQPDQFAWITPLLGNISDECRTAGEKYRDNIMQILNSGINEAKENGSITPAALKMFDSNGRLPMEGFLSDVLDIPFDLCQIIGDIPCLLPNQVRNVVLKIPLGYSYNPGCHEECLSVDNMETRYCTVSLQGPNFGFGGFISYHYNFASFNPAYPGFDKWLDYSQISNKWSISMITVGFGFYYGLGKVK